MCRSEESKLVVLARLEGDGPCSVSFLRIAAVSAAKASSDLIHVRSASCVRRDPSRQLPRPPHYGSGQQQLVSFNSGLLCAQHDTLPVPIGSPGLIRSSHCRMHHGGRRLPMRWLMLAAAVLAVSTATGSAALQPRLPARSCYSAHALCDDLKVLRSHAAATPRAR